MAARRFPGKDFIPNPAAWLVGTDFDHGETRIHTDTETDSDFKDGTRIGEDRFVRIGEIRVGHPCVSVSIRG
jgi:hypothetical protein